MRIRIGAYEARKRGAARYDPGDPFYFASTVPWSLFLVLLFGLWVLSNLAFAAIYLAGPGSIANARRGAISDAFFFSVETMATVGYGVFSPATLYGHIVSTFEIFYGMAFAAIATGLTFLRFSRPKARFVYAQNPVVDAFNGRPMLMVRVANGRTSSLTDATARLSVLLDEETQEGRTYRRFHELPLVRQRLPLFPLAWTIMHDLGPESPLHGMDADWLGKRHARLYLMLNARDLALGAFVHDTRDYDARDILFGMRYAEAVITDNEGRTLADLTLLSEVEPAE